MYGKKVVDRGAKQLFDLFSIILYNDMGFKIYRMYDICDNVVIERLGI